MATEPVATEPAVAEPPVAEPVAGTVDLAISVTFDKTEFFVDELVTALARVTNTGSVAATEVHLDSTTNLDHADWDGFPSYQGVRIEPGQTVEGTLRSRTRTMDTPVILGVTARSDQPDANPADNTATVTVPIKVQRGDYTGVVYGDRNGNAVMDPGEALVDLHLSATGGVPHTSYSAATDSAGRFTFHDLPRGEYRTTFHDLGWSFHAPPVQVDGVDDPDVVVRGAHLVDRVLTAAARFDQPGYRVGDTARMSLVLTNSGSAPIPGLTAACDSSGGPMPDFGDLVGVGVTVPANSTWATSAPVTIDAAAVVRGALVVNCTFGAPPHSNGYVFARAIARVPGARADRVVGQVGFSARPPTFSPRPGAPVPNVKVYLKDQVTGAVVARAITDAQGHFEFRDVPAGVHDFGLVGPYLSLGGRQFQDMHVVAVALQEVGFVYVTTGPDQPDPDPAPRPGDPPSPAPPGAGPGQQPPLAATGVDVAWLALGGLLTLLAGFGLITSTRRRRA
ncbi:hypothetical protein [Saccharothrix stipae]